MQVCVCVNGGNALKFHIAFSTNRDRDRTETGHKAWAIEKCKLMPSKNQREREREKERERERESERHCWKNVIKSVYGVLSLTHKSGTTCSLEVITPGSRDILHVNSESLHLKLGVKIPFPPVDKLNHLQDDRTRCCWGLQPPLLSMCLSVIQLQ